MRKKVEWNGDTPTVVSKRYCKTCAWYGGRYCGIRKGMERSNSAHDCAHWSCPPKRAAVAVRASSVLFVGVQWSVALAATAALVAAIVNATPITILCFFVLAIVAAISKIKP